MDRHRRVAVRAPGLAQGFVAECRVELARVDRARQQFHVLEAALAEEVAQLARRHQGGVGEVVEVAHPAQCHRLQERRAVRSEEHTSELQSLMRISYAVFCLNKKTNR